jgi:hypothetical protein
LFEEEPIAGTESVEAESAGDLVTEPSDDLATESDRRFRKFESEGWAASRGIHSCICRLLRRHHIEGYSGCVPPDLADNAMWFKNSETKESILTSQPGFADQGDVDRITKAALDFAQKTGLKVSVSTEDSWYLPGSTVLVTYRSYDPKFGANVLYGPDPALKETLRPRQEESVKIWDKHFDQLLERWKSREKVILLSKDSIRTAVFALHHYASLESILSGERAADIGKRGAVKLFKPDDVQELIQF